MRDRREGRAVVLRARRRRAAATRPRPSSTRRRARRRPHAGGRSEAPRASSTPSGAGASPESFAGEIERHYSPGRTWQSLAAGLAALLRLGDVLDVGSGDGAAASALAPYCRSLTCIDTSARMIDAAQRAARRSIAHVARPGRRRARLPFRAGVVRRGARLPHAHLRRAPARALEECARVLRPGGRLVVLSPRPARAARGHRALRRAPPRLLAARTPRACSSRAGLDVVVSRGRLSRSQEAALRGRAGHRRQAQSLEHAQ